MNKTLLSKSFVLGIIAVSASWYNIPSAQATEYNVDHDMKWRDVLHDSDGIVLYGGDKLTITNDATVTMDFGNNSPTPGVPGGLAMTIQNYFGDTSKDLLIKGGNFYAITGTEGQGTGAWIQDGHTGRIILDKTNLHFKGFYSGLKTYGSEINVTNDKTVFENIGFGIWVDDKNLENNVPKVNINTKKLDITGGIVASYQKGGEVVIQVTEYANIATEAGDLFNVKNGGKLSFSSAAGNLVGDLYTDNGNVEMDLGSNTNWRGASYPNQYYDNDKIKVSLKDNSQWEVTDTSAVTDLIAFDGGKVSLIRKEEGYLELYTNRLQGNNGIINMNIDAGTNVDNCDKLYIDNIHTGQHYITLHNINPEGLTDGAEGTVLVSVNDEQGKFLAKPTEGTLYWNKYELGSKESLTDGYNTDWYLKTASQSEVDPEPEEPTYTTSVDTIMSTNALNYHTWRESDKLLQRMGELRHNGAEEKGAWFRVKGSEIERSGLFGFGNKYTTYQLGYDEISKRTDKMTRYQGFALSYTDGNSSYKHGSGDNHSKAISFYNTDQRSKGHYLDLVLQISDMDNDFKVYDTNGQKITGDFDNKGISISAEYGRKKDLGSNWYIEPQAQMTFGYLSGDDYATSNGIRVEQSGIFSAVGRVGFNIGKNIGERGIIYAKANVLHEFGGDYDVQMRDASGQITKNDRFNDTWFAYGVGAAFATGKQSHIYFDVEKTTGSDFSKNWQWNAGIRYNF